MRKAGRAIGYIFTLFILAAAALVGKKVADWALPPLEGGRPTEAILSEVVEKTNKKMPIMIDQHTRMDSVTLPSTMVLQNNYTLLNLDTSFEGEFDEIREKIRAMIVGRACSTPSVTRLLDMGITNVYSYNAADGTFFGAVTVTKADCRR